MAPILGCVAVVDPVSTGANLACEVAARGYAVIAVWDREIGELRSHVPLAARHLQYLGEVEEHATVSETAAALRRVAADAGLELVACLVGSEAGVTLADELAEVLGLRGNGTAVQNRRNKSVQQKLVAAAGLRAVREAVGKRWSEVAAFVAKEPMPVVVKPVESAGSDGVKLCYSREEAEEHFNRLMGAQRKVGSQDAAVLVQEFLKGNEYVVDHVSRDGIHKTTMIWVYDKRPCNGAHFVYFGSLPVPADAEVVKQLVPYVRGVLDALGIKNGPTHGEVMMTEDGPCLVEMNCRAHGGDGAWMPLASALTGGYTQVSAAVDAFLEPDAFDKLPNMFPSPFKASGSCLDLVCMQEGTVLATPGFDRLKQLPSFVSLDTHVSVGSRVELTVDMFTGIGSAVLVHPNATVLAHDVEVVRQMETNCELFVVEEHAVTLGRPRTESDLPSKVAPRARAGSVGSDAERTNLRRPVEKATASPLASPAIAAAFIAGLLLGVALGRRTR